MNKHYCLDYELARISIPALASCKAEAAKYEVAFATVGCNTRYYFPITVTVCQ